MAPDPCSYHPCTRTPRGPAAHGCLVHGRYSVNVPCTHTCLPQAGPRSPSPPVLRTSHACAQRRSPRTPPPRHPTFPRITKNGTRPGSFLGTVDTSTWRTPLGGPPKPEFWLQTGGGGDGWQETTSKPCPTLQPASHMAAATRTGLKPQSREGAGLPTHSYDTSPCPPHLPLFPNQRGRPPGSPRGLPAPRAGWTWERAQALAQRVAMASLAGRRGPSHTSHQDSRLPDFQNAGPPDPDNRRCGLPGPLQETPDSSSSRVSGFCPSISWEPSVGVGGGGDGGGGGLASADKKTPSGPTTPGRRFTHLPTLPCSWEGN